MIAKFDNNISIYLNWNNAEELNIAWFYCASDEFKMQYRDSGRNQLKSNAIRYMMEKDVRRSIGETELIALGIQIYPILGTEPEIIPAMMFASQSVQIDWEKSLVEGLGKKFNDVRLCLKSIQNAELTMQVLPILIKRGGGRTDTYPRAKEILSELFAENSRYKEASAAKLLALFNKQYLNNSAQSEIKMAPLAERTLRNHLKKYRQELAAIDKNNFAN